MFSDAERSQLREQLIAAAAADPRIEAAAVVGSAAAGREDSWSDIDLALRLADGLVPTDVVGGWTELMYDSHAAVAHVDVWAEPALYRVFLIANSLQVDISFWPAGDFAQRGGAFRLVFGSANKPFPRPERPPQPLIGLAWLYGLHVRSSIARSRPLQALYMLNNMRDQVISLACLRSALSPVEARGADDLPPEVRQHLDETVPRGLDAADLRRAFARLTDLLVAEADAVDAAAAHRLRPVLAELVRSAAAGN
jgi:predicted nucleotidyltransferase